MKGEKEADERIKEAMIRLIKRTDDATAPVKVEAAYKAAEAVGMMLTSISDRQRVKNFEAALLPQYDDDEIARFSCRPEFVVALAAMFCESIIAFINNKEDELCH